MRAAASERSCDLRHTGTSPRPVTATPPSPRTVAGWILRRPEFDRGRDSVIAGLTLSWNSGLVKGHVDRIKMLKRQVFGRAGFQLLRKPALLARAEYCRGGMGPTGFEPASSHMR